MCIIRLCREGGGYLLSHFRSTIGVAGFNFSVRNGKRWSPRAMATLVYLFPGTGTYRPAGMGQVGSTLEAMTYLFYSRLLLSYTITCYFGDYTPQERVRAISIARLWTLLPLHLQPIYVVVCNDPMWRSYLEEGFVLRCFQHLSCPDADTRRCTWRYNR